MVDLVGDRGLPRLSPPHLYLTLSATPFNHPLPPTENWNYEKSNQLYRYHIVLKNINFIFTKG